MASLMLAADGWNEGTSENGHTWGCTIDLSRPLHKSSPFVSTATEATDEDHHRFIENGFNEWDRRRLQLYSYNWSGRQQGETDARKINYTGSRTGRRVSFLLAAQSQRSPRPCVSAVTSPLAAPAAGTAAARSGRPWY